MKTEAYCVKCKEKTWIDDPVQSVLKNGVKAIKGKCSECGTGVMKILGTSKPKKTAAPKTESTPTPVAEASGGWTLLG